MRWAAGCGARSHPSSRPVAALTHVSTAGANSFTLPHADVRVTVAKDGSLRAVEQIDVAFSGSLTFGYRDITLRTGSA